jgi:hypothetical protein
MSITQYTNFTELEANLQNQGEFLQPQDLFIVSQNQIDDTDFGECKYDVMEVSIYDVNSVLLPQSNGNLVAYIKKDDIKNYLYLVTNQGGQKELVVDAQKLLNDLGFTNGIYKLNINFVRDRVGTEDASRRVWIQEISPSRTEIRIIPLKTADSNINNLNTNEFNNLSNLNKDFKYYKKSLLDSINSFANIDMSIIDSMIQTQYGNDFFTILKTDFGLSNFDNIRDKIFSDFKNAVTYYLTNKEYDITQSNFGQPSEIRFEDCEQYDFTMLVSAIEKILFDCVDFNCQFLKRRDINITEVPVEFKVTELNKLTKNNTDSFPTATTVNTNIYDPANITINANTSATIIPIVVTPIDTPAPEPVITLPPVVITPTPEPVVIQPAPISGGGTGVETIIDTNPDNNSLVGNNLSDKEFR